MSFMKRIRSHYKVSADVSNTGFPYYRVSDSTKISMPPERKYDPYGMYLFIKGESVDVGGMWGSMKWRRDAKLKTNKLLDLSKVSISLAKKILKNSGLTLQDVWELKDKSIKGAYDRPEEVVDEFFGSKLKAWKSDSETPSEAQLEQALKANKWLGGSVYRVLRLTVKSGKEFTEIIKQAGFNGILDTIDAIYPNEPQCIIFDQNDIIWGDLEKNVLDDKVYCLTED